MANAQLDWFVALGRAVAEGVESGESIAKRIGSVRTVAGDTLYINPSDARYESALVSLDPKTKKVRSATVQVRRDHQLPTVAELEQRFGPGAPGSRTHPQAPLGLSFTIDFGREFSSICALIADVPNSFAPKAEWRVQSISVVADARL